MDSYQSLLGISDVTIDTLNTDTIVVNKDLTVFGEAILTGLQIPVGASLNKVLTCTSLLGDATWAVPADATLVGDCTGFSSNNRVDTLAGGTIPVSTLVTLSGTQTLTNKTFTNMTVNNTISSASSSGLSLSSTGGTYGPSKVTVQNIAGCNGMLLDTTGSSVALTDVVCKSGTKAMNLRFEARTASLLNALNSSHGEYQVLLNNSLTPAAYFGTAASGIYGTLNAAAVSCTGFKMATGAALGSVLTSDASGNAAWLAPAVVSSVGDLTMSGKLLDPLGKYLIARSGNTVFMGGAGMNIFNQSNLAIGYNACSTINAFGFCATGHVAIGNNSLLNSAGNYNCAVGFQSCMANTSGSSNCGFGTNVLLANTVGNGNTAVGHFAGQSITAGYNTCVGERSDVSAGITNSMALGYQAIASTSNTIQLGNASVVSVNTSGTINTPALNAGTLNAGASILSTLGVGNLNAGPTTLETLVVGLGTTLATLNAGATTVTTLNAGTTVVGGLTANATTLASLNVNGNSLLQQLGVMSTISCQYGISCGSLTFHSGTALSYFEEFSMAIKWSGPFATIINDTIKIVRIGSLVTVQFNGFSDTVTLVSNIIQFDASTLIPARFVRSFGTTGMCTGDNAGVATNLYLSVNTSGYIFITLLSNAAFSSGTCSLNPCTFSWVL